EENAASFVARRDVEKAHFVGPSRVIGLGSLDRIARVDEVDESDTLDHASVLDVETRYDAGLQHDAPVRMAGGSSPARSGRQLGEPQARRSPRRRSRIRSAAGRK